MNNRFIQKLTIENFKSIKKLNDFEVRNINILIGANGAGKSNFLSFFSFVRNIIECNLGGYVARKGKADGILTFGKKHSSFLSAKIEFEQNIYGFKLLPNDSNAFYFEDEYTEYKLNKSKFDFAKNNDESRLLAPEAKAYHAKHFAPQFKKILQYHFHDTGDSSPIKSDDYVYDNQQLKFDGKNIGAFIRRLKFEYPENYHTIIKTISLAVPDFHDFYIQDTLKTTDQIPLFWINKNDIDSIQHPSLLSDGSLRFICLVTVLFQPVELMPDIIIIDEPELGLHPKALSIIASLIQRVAFQKQFIIATQSSAMVDLFEPEDIIVVDKNEDGTSSFNRQDAKKMSQWLEDYSLSELWDMNIIGGRP